VFINGDSDGVGAIALQLLKHYGHHVTIVCSSANAPKFTRELVDAAAGEVIDSAREPDWLKRLADQGTEYDVLLDTVGSDEAEAECLKLIKRGGKYLSLRPLVLDHIHEHGPFMVRRLSHVLHARSASLVVCVCA
jgi:NADPH:quinone reductase-like Zn-dependent oxidoreductase